MRTTRRGLVLSVAALTILTGTSVAAAGPGGLHGAAKKKPATKLAVTAPAHVAKVTAFSITVKAKTKSGAVAKTYRGKVSFTSSDHHAVLPKPYTFTKKDNGKHRFTTLYFLTAGTQTITAKETKHAKIKGKVSIKVTAPVVASSYATVTTIACADDQTETAGSDICRATVTAPTAPAGTKPTGAVNFTTDSGGGFGALSDCTLDTTGASSTCTVAFSAASSDPHSQNVTGTYVPSSASYKASSGTDGVTVCDGTYTVDVVTGTDTNSGSCLEPFETISRALTVAHTVGGFNSIAVDSGTYKDTNGETFPLDIPGGTTLIGIGSPPIINGTVQLDGSFIGMTNFIVTAQVTNLGSSNEIQNSVLKNGTNCLSVSTGDIELVDDTVQDCTSSGVYVADQTSLTAANSMFTGSATNLNVNGNGSIDLSTGGNTVRCGTSNDLLDHSTGSLNAANVAWDHAPPTQATGASPSSADIFIVTGSSAVTTAGYTLAANAC